MNYSVSRRILFASSSSLVLCLCTQARSEESSFQTLSFHCEPEHESGPEASPQSPPLTLDDPDTPGCNRWEINVTFDADLSRDEQHQELPLLDVNYGIGDNLQVKLEKPLLLETKAGTSSKAWGPTKVGVKYLFFENPKEHLKLAVYPQFEKGDAGSEDGDVLTLPLLISLKIAETEFGDLVLGANVAYESHMNPQHVSVLHAATGLGVPIGRSLSMMGELALEEGQTRGNTGERRTEILKSSVGILVALQDSISVYGSLGASLKSSDAKQHIYILSGLRWTAP